MLTDFEIKKAFSVVVCLLLLIILLLFLLLLLLVLLLLYKTNRFHVAVCLFSNESQKTSKCGKNMGDTRQHGIYLLNIESFAKYNEEMC